MGALDHPTDDISTSIVISRDDRSLSAYLSEVRRYYIVLLKDISKSISCHSCVI